MAANPLLKLIICSAQTFVFHLCERTPMKLVRSPPRPIRPKPPCPIGLQIRKNDRTAALGGLGYSGGRNEETALYGLLNGFGRLSRRSVLARALGPGRSVRPPAATAQDGPMSSSGSPCRNSTRSSLSPRVRTTSTRTEARAATRHAPRPQAVPRAAVTQIVAAVVM